MQTFAVPEKIIFGPFALDLSARALLAAGEKLPLSSRAFDILALLVAERGRVVGKDEIIAKVWRGVAVEENNLAVQMSSLRRVLSQHADGAAMITTVPGQGYRFVARVEAAPAPLDFGLPDPPASPAPQRVSPVAERRRLWTVLVACVGLGAAMLVAVLLWWPAAAPAPRLSIAVLPFRNLGDDPTQDSLADAISDDLTTDLSHLPGSTVRARESSDAYKGRAVPAEQIGRDLKVRYLLEGSLRGVEGVFRINAQLIDASHGGHLWADRFDVPRDKLASAQSAIVGHIASILKVKLVALESERSLRERPNNSDAWDLYFRARAIRDRAETLAEFTSAQKLLEEALVLRPNFVDALTDLSLVLLAKRTDFDDPNDVTDLARARQLAQQALVLAPKNAGALTAQGWLLSIDGEVRRSEASYEAAVAADPTDAPARAGLADNDWLLGRPEATIETLKYVLQLDPEGPAVKRRMALLGMAYFLAGKWQDSIDWLLRSMAGDPGTTSAGGDRLEFSQMFLIAAYQLTGDSERAKKLYADYNRTWPNRSVWRLASYFSKAQTNTPQFKLMKSALILAGMPEFSHPQAGRYLVTQASESQKGDFDLCPAEIPGTTAIDVVDLPRLMGQVPKPFILDVGSGAATLPSAQWTPRPDAPAGRLDDTLRRAGWMPGEPLLIVGAGSYGWSAYGAAAELLAGGIKPVFWLRGGEESLAAAGIPTVDRRVP